ncbi:MAG TPA: nuclear transport factor 2 family protein [Caulobacteraceae bacterium]|jgi:limonene-1,2-epoxide hydrolase|nr:nuclear transport factor 2 family protein [Caulobacteraceae bacterium]
MPDAKRVEAFMAAVEAGDYDGAIERFYAPDASMRENTLSQPRVGREALVAHERMVMAQFPTIIARRMAEPAISGDQVAIHWRFEFQTADGARRVMEEIAWQTWRGAEIAEEVFFYDPAQMAAAAVS